jgi:hypothetical protein
MKANIPAHPRIESGARRYAGDRKCEVQQVEQIFVALKSLGKTIAIFKEEPKTITKRLPRHTIEIQNELTG